MNEGRSFGFKSVSKLNTIDFLAYSIIFFCILFGISSFLLQSNQKELLQSGIDWIYSILLLTPYWIYIVIGVICGLFAMIA